VKGFCASVPLARVAELDYVLTPGRYVGLPDEDDDFNFAERFAALKAEFEAQLLEEAALNQAIVESLARVKVTLDDVAIINPIESLKKGQLAKKIAMESLQPFTKNPSGFSWEEFNGGMKFRNGDTLVARITPCLENGKTSYIDILNEGEIGFGSTEYIVLREKPQISDKQFLYYFCISPIFRDVAILSMTGSSGRQRVQTDVVRQHLFELPPIKEQKTIASVLSSLDDKIDLLHRQNKTLEAMAETLFRQWFVEEVENDWEEGTIYDLIEFNPTRKLAKGEMAPYLEMAALSTYTFNPDGWYLREFSSGY
jgi:restriction endonuclease S subunit